MVTIVAVPPGGAVVVVVVVGFTVVDVVGGTVVDVVVDVVGGPVVDVVVDVVGGTVVDVVVEVVGGRIVEPLTDLEYRLLLLLYGRMDKICDKYQIVESVWGQDYLGEVDDARIEKLISRLRAKLEPDPARPQCVITVRGRGYKLSYPKDEPETDEE